jgi:flagellar basal body rod protein FlgB
MTTPDKAAGVFDWIAKRFDERITAYYSEGDLKAGCITAKDRQGNVKKFSFVSASIVYLTDKNIETNQYPILIQALTEMKGYVKHTIERKGGNNVDIDREISLLAQNTVWYSTLAQISQREFSDLRSAITEGKK